MKLLKALGRLENGFGCEGIPKDEVEGYSETKDSGLGKMIVVRHSGEIASSRPCYAHLLEPLGSDSPEWL